MTRLFWLRRKEQAFTGHFDAAHRWGLPGVRCTTCGVTWAGAGHQYPGVDLSQMPERSEFEVARPEPFPVFTRLRELVRPVCPPGADLPPGTTFGPLVGSASGTFGPVAWQGNMQMLMHRNVLERLQADGVRGLNGYRTELRFRKKEPPEMLELQIEPRGRFHPDCLPPNLPPPCGTCCRLDFSRPEQPLLDAVSLPPNLDLFRVGNFATMIIGTERFVDAVRHLGLDGIAFREIPIRHG